MTKTQKLENIENITFEEALARLEKINAGLSVGEIPLAEAMAGYQEGVALVKHCYKLLEQAQGQFQVLENGTWQEK